MKKKLVSFQKKTVIVLCVLMLCSGLPVMAAELPELPATREQACELLLIQGIKYNPNLSKEDIMKGYGDGLLRENDPVGRDELYVMLSRAFGPLPVPKGGLLVMMPEPVAFENVPNWAQTDIENIINAQIIPESKAMDEYVSLDEIKLLIQRAHSILSTSEKDDFYMVVNREFIENAVIPQGEHTENRATIMQRAVDENLNSIISEIISGEYEENSPEWRIAKYYHAYMDRILNDREGMKSFKNELDLLLRAETLEDLTDASLKISEDLGFNLIADFSMAKDLLNSEKKIMTFELYDLVELKDFYMEPSNEQLFVEYFANLMKLADFDEEYAKNAAQSLYNFEKELSADSLNLEDYSNPEKVYNLFTFDDIQSMIPNLALGKVLTGSGLKEMEEIRILDVGICQKFGSMYTQENFNLLKASFTARFVQAALLLLETTGYLNEQLNYDQKMYGIEGSKSDEQKVLEQIKNIFGDYLAPMYVERYFSPEAKADVERMCREYIDQYRQRIKNLDWMSETTKEMAIKKLDAMSLCIGYPKKYDTQIIDNMDYRGSYAAIYSSLMIESRKQEAREQFSPVDKEIWEGFTPYTVNAFYSLSKNSICIPAGFLQAPFYDMNAKQEANYGGIGYVIGHEITHGFDNSGSQFDENGNVRNWWSEEDFAAFETLLAKVIDLYDGYEIYPGISNNGIHTLGENVADLGGIACSLSILEKLNNPDYDVFFKTNTACYATSMYRLRLEYLGMADIHSYMKARVNLAYGNFKEFIDTYGITEYDYMYISPEKRITIW